MKLVARSRFRRLGEGMSLSLPSGLTGTRWARQAIIAGLILALLLAVQRLPFGLARRFEAGVRYVMTTEYNFAGAMDKLASVGRLRNELNLPALSSWIGSNESQEGSREAGEGSPMVEMAMPVEGQVSSAFGWRVHPVSSKEEFHQGVDLDAAEGSNVMSVLDGRVISVGEREDYGKVVEVDHDRGLTTLYAHNSEILVKIGEEVKRGQPIARVGKSGNATSSHLHFEVRVDGKQVDPRPWLGMK